MKIKWLGHSSFLVTSESGTKIITDPYVIGGNLQYDEIKESADIVLVSHEHRDHNNAAAVQGNPEVVKEAGTFETKGIKCKGVATYHDNVGGQQRGPNTVFCFEVDGIRVCHLGDLGHRLSDEQVAEIGSVDILFIPVGGYFTIDAELATEVADRLAPKVIIPMHFKTEKYKGPVVGADDFLRGKKDVKQLDTSELEFKAAQLPTVTQVIVIRPAL